MDCYGSRPLKATTRRFAVHNMLWAMGAGVATVLVLYVPGILRLGESIVPGILVVPIVYLLLARRTFKKAEHLFSGAAKVLSSNPPKFDLAIHTIEAAYTLAPKQFGIKSQADAQIGIIYFLKQEFNKALPYLEQSLRFGHWLAGAMLAVVYYKKKDHANMEKTLGVVVKRAKKEPLAWCLYAYLLTQTGKREQAQQILVEGTKKTKDDAKVKDALLSVQNNKKIKMRTFKEQWYQFHLERPPADYQQMLAGGRMSKASLRGRW